MGFFYFYYGHFQAYTKAENVSWIPAYPSLSFHTGPAWLVFHMPASSTSPPCQRKSQRHPSSSSVNTSLCFSHSPLFSTHTLLLVCAMWERALCLNPLGHLYLKTMGQRVMAARPRPRSVTWLCFCWQCEAEWALWPTDPSQLHCGWHWRVQLLGAALQWLHMQEGWDQNGLHLHLFYR